MWAVGISVTILTISGLSKVTIMMNPEMMKFAAEQVSFLVSQLHGGKAELLTALARGP